MELRTLRYFLAVAREQNMTEAANILRVTQPTLSRQMADLERELGCALFVRTNRATMLTADGMRLRQRAEEILQLVQQAEDEMGARREIAGVVRIGAGETQAMRVLTDTFAELRRNHPRVTCQLFTGNADAVEERLERGLVDFALMIEPVSVEKYDHLALPARDTVGVIVGTHGPWGMLDAVTPQTLVQMPLLISSRTTHQTFDLAAWSDGERRGHLRPDWKRRAPGRGGHRLRAGHRPPAGAADQQAALPTAGARPHHWLCGCVEEAQDLLACVRSVSEAAASNAGPVTA